MLKYSEYLVFRKYMNTFGDSVLRPRENLSMSIWAFESEAAAVLMIASYCSLSVFSSSEPFSEMAVTNAQK